MFKPQCCSYEACTQPKAVAVAQGKIPVPVDVQIDRNGRVQGLISSAAAFSLFYLSNLRQIRGVS
jgi:hypothetical protein